MSFTLEFPTKPHQNSTHFSLHLKSYHDDGRSRLFPLNMTSFFFPFYCFIFFFFASICESITPPSAAINQIPFKMPSIFICILSQEIMTEKVSFPVRTRHVINAKDDISFFLQVVLELGSSKPNPIQNFTDLSLCFKSGSHDR